MERRCHGGRTLGGGGHRRRRRRRAAPLGDPAPGRHRPHAAHLRRRHLGLAGSLPRRLAARLRVGLRRRRQPRYLGAAGRRGGADPGDARCRRRPDAGIFPRRRTVDLPLGTRRRRHLQRAGTWRRAAPDCGGRAGATPVARRPAPGLLDRVVHRLLAGAAKLSQLHLDVAGGTPRRDYRIHQQSLPCVVPRRHQADPVGVSGGGADPRELRLVGGADRRPARESDSGRPLLAAPSPRAAARPPPATWTGNRVRPRSRATSGPSSSTRRRIPRWSSNA